MEGLAVEGLRVAVAVDADGACEWHGAVVDALVALPEISVVAVFLVAGVAPPAWALTRRLREHVRTRAASRSRALAIVEPLTRFESVPIVGDPTRVAALIDQPIDLVVSFVDGPLPDSLRPDSLRPDSLRRPASPGTLLPLLAGHRDARRALHRRVARVVGDRSMTLGVHRADDRGRPGPAVAEACVRATASESVRGVDNALLNVAPLLVARACTTPFDAVDPRARRRRRRDLGVAPRLRRARFGVRALVLDRVPALVASPQWNVGVVGAPIHRFLDDAFVPQVEWLPRPRRGHFVADPFGLPADDRGWLAESYDYDTRRGFIAAIGTNGTAPAPAPVIEIETHASYPYLVEDGSDIFCIPQVESATGIRIFRAVSYPTHWEDAGVLVPDVSARDTTVFEHDGRWWLAYTDGATGPFTHLHVWWADEFLGPWREHAANPVKIDLRSARPAGTPFRHDGVLYRPAQDCSATYGGAVAICRVDELTPTTFHEEVVRIVAPLPGLYRHGFHTLSSIGDRTLVDGKAYAFTLADARTVFRSRLQRVIGGEPSRSAEPR